MRSEYVTRKRCFEPTQRIAFFSTWCPKAALSVNSTSFSRLHERVGTAP
jgi:hypothetical protein